MTLHDTESPSTTDRADGFESLARRVDDAVSKVAALDDDTRSVAIELKDAIEAFHKSALSHVVGTLLADPEGKRLLFDLVDEPSVRAVLALHGLIKADPMTRARRALDGVQPYIQSHGGDVELVSIEAGTAFIRLHGACNGCSMSAMTLQEGIETALVEGVEEISKVEVLEDEPTAAFVPLGQIGTKTSADHGWVDGPAIDDVAAGGMHRFDVTIGSQLDSFVITHVEGKVAAFRNECVHQGRELDGGMLDDGVLVCPWHGFRFDAQNGECLNAPGAQLQPVPVRIEDGRIRLRVHDGQRR